MSEITAKAVKALRDATGAGMMDAKKALTEAGGDPEAATQILREKGLSKAAKRSDRENSEGAVAMAQDGNKVAVVLLRSETDFSAKSEDFVAVAQKLADSALAGEDPAVACATDIEDLMLSKKENIDVGAVHVVEAAEGNALDTYLHVQDGRGTIGIVVEGSGVDAEALHAIALHCAFANPLCLDRSEVSAEDAEKERAALLEITKSEGKPEQAWDKIVEGRMTAWYKESVLLEQGLNGDKVSVADTAAPGTIVRFVQARIGA
jgi:elongation factor Ts